MDQTVLLVGLGLLAGGMIGCVGIGGVILVPAMTLLAGIPAGSAIAAAMLGYILTGLSGTVVFLRHRTVDRRAAAILCLGAGPGALLGAVLAQRVDGRVILALVACLAIASGLHNLSGAPRDRPARRPFAPGGLALAAIGTLVGLLSALTGTGGPVVLVPLLLALDVPVLAAVGLSQTIQVPIALLATLGALALGVLDLRLGLPLTVGLGLGSALGAGLAHRLDRAALRRIAALILLATGTFIVGQALVRAAV